MAEIAHYHALQPIARTTENILHNLHNRKKMYNFAAIFFEKYI